MTNETKNHFINDFEKRLKQVKNEEYTIQNEINQIEIFTSTDGNFQGFQGDLNFDNETNSVFNLMHIGNRAFFNSIYHQYLQNEEYESILDKSFFEDGQFLPEIEEAVKFSEYYLWLKKLQSNPIINKKVKTIPHKQKMLILYYLGLTTSEQDNTKIAKILSQVLELSEENTRRYLSWVQTGKNDVRTKKNLNAVKTLFDSNNLTEISNQIQEDIDSIK